MNLVAITNASELISVNDNKVINVGLKNKNIIALGYLPDDETFEEINAKQSIIIENSFNLIDGFSDKLENQNDGISFSSDLYKSLKFMNTYSFLNSYKTIKYEPKKTYIFYVSLSELLFIIQESNFLKKDSSFHFILDATNESIQTIKNINFNNNISIGLIINDSIDFKEIDIIEVFKKKKVITLSSKQRDKLLPIIFELFYKKNINLIDQIFSPFFIKNLTKKQLSLGTKPNLTFIKKKYPFEIICTLRKGDIYLTKKGEKDDI